MATVRYLLLAGCSAALTCAMPLYGRGQFVAASEELVLTTFDGSKSSTQQWRDVNDPVMGGQSTSQFKIAKGLGIFSGETKIVPKLKAPGFCNLQADHASFPDISTYSAIKLVLRSTIPYKGFKLAFGPAPRTGFFASYKADFTTASTPDAEGFQTVTIPFDNFSSKWSSYTGEPTTTCASDKSVCPDASHLRHLSSMEIAAEGVAGKFNLEIKSISAVTTALLSDATLTAGENIVELAATVKDLSTLVTALKAANLTSTLAAKGPFTVFAPTNEAFAALPKETLTHLLDPRNIKELQAVLEYHVIAGASVHAADLREFQKVATLEGDDVVIFKRGSEVVVDHARVVKADVAASNGVVHIIDRVLIPYHKPAPSPPAPATANIVELAATVKDLSTLVAALKAANLTSPLAAKGPFTVFAPTNEAFERVPKRALDRLLDPRNIKELQAVLEYHVVAGAAVFAKDLKPVQDVKTLEGGDVRITELFGSVHIDYARVVKADVGATNGVVHIIDHVLFTLRS